jgi:hypothetical protein
MTFIIEITYKCSYIQGNINSPYVYIKAPTFVIIAKEGRSHILGLVLFIVFTG